MNAATILQELHRLGREGYKQILLKHDIPEPVLGVKIEELKKIQKRVGKDYQLALDLYDSGIYDAQYLAGLIADDAKMTQRNLQRWADRASRPVAAYTVPAVTAGSPHAFALARKWIEAKKEHVAVAGWGTWSSLVSIKPDEELDLNELKALLQRVQRTIHSAPNAVRYQMNAFVISVGCYVKPLTPLAKEIAAKMGKVTVDMGDTACQVPDAAAYIRKVEQRGTIGKKRKSAKC